ncbi:hypothetical protein Hdeb2414_s0024g00646341 [Helianthus debilis subsp. tardiflorus]
MWLIGAGDNEGDVASGSGGDSHPLLRWASLQGKRRQPDPCFLFRSADSSDSGGGSRLGFTLKTMFKLWVRPGAVQVQVSRFG